MFSIFKNDKTRWIPFGAYSHGSDDYIVFIRGNKKTGMMYFKVKRVHRFAPFSGRILPSNFIDVKAQWDEIIKMTDNK